MLVYFKVGNYKSIKEPVVINFTASAINEHNDTNVFEKGKLKLLKTVLLYGPNAGGKSSILDAFVTFKNLILNSTNHNSTTELPFRPFLLNIATREQSTHFEAEFILKSKRYRYGFEADKKSIKKEWLLEVKATVEHPVFLRIGQQFKIDFRKFLHAEKLDKRCNENVLFLSVADQWNVPLAKTIYGWYARIFTIHGLMDTAYKDFTNDLFEEPVYKQLINEMINKADLGINSVNVLNLTEELITDFLKDAPESVRERMSLIREIDPNPITTIHSVYDNEGNIVDETSFSMDMQESEGTKKFYNIIGPILYAVKNNVLVVIDELDARIHPLLSKAIIRLFNAANVKSEAQLLGVSHDTAVMDRDLLRRDQIYFVEKDKFAATKVVNLVEYKVRKESPFDKNYLEGKYGGIPFIENFENVLKNGEA